MNDETGKFSSDSQLQFQHPYPATKIMFIPDKEGNCPDLVATTGDYLRIWQLTEEGTTLQKLLNNVSSSPCRQSLNFPSVQQDILLVTSHALETCHQQVLSAEAYHDVV